MNLNWKKKNKYLRATESTEFTMKGERKNMRATENTYMGKDLVEK